MDERLYNLTLTAFAYGGDAIGRIHDDAGGDRVVFVPFAMPGERVRVRLVEQRRGFARGELMEVIEPSPERIMPRCKHFGECGGCHYQYMPYELQLQAKTDILRDQFRRNRQREPRAELTGELRAAMRQETESVFSYVLHEDRSVLELLNSKVDHKDYMCDHTPWGVELVKKVGSERFKLLYDIYHIQIMEGDMIATIKASHQYIGHYHTGGVPGRNEIDETQEINYPAVIRAIAETGYTGYVAQEFIPVREPLQSLREAVKLCERSQRK